MTKMTRRRVDKQGRPLFWDSFSRSYVPNIARARKLSTQSNKKLDRRVKAVKNAKSQNIDKGMYERFRNEAQSFLLKYDTLKNKKTEVDRYPELKKEYGELIGSGSNIYSSVKTVTGGIDNVVGWFNSIFGSDAELNGLGLLPLVPIAVVIGSVAAMGKWGRDVYLFDARLKEIQRLESRGLSPEQASKIVSEKVEPGILAGVTREVMVPLSIAGVVLIAGYFLIKK